LQLIGAQQFSFFKLIARVLLDCSIRIIVQFGGLDCDCGFWIWIVNPIFVISIQIQKISEIFHQEIKIS